jgi:predicted AAA+ superfamily ATPase
MCAKASARSIKPDKSGLVFPKYAILNFQNIGKQVTKIPKVYFYDTGLLCCPLGLTGIKELGTHYLIGSIFENFIIPDIQKELMNRKALYRLFFFREKNDNGVGRLINWKQVNTAL